jgi:multiple sugar transport system substrate-binding protein
MDEYAKLMPYMGDYYQLTSGWTQARTSWWNMLQRVGAGDDVASTVTTFVAEANAAAG